MASPGRIPSSPPKGVSIQEELAYYKSQYEQVELDLQEFQASSKELEAELEKDVEESEKRERALREKAEALGFEVEEWKSKYKQSKAEATNAQSSLQKEITTLRDTCRTLQFKIRDIEVQNDDFERQARNQTSSLEDLESKYNVSIERGVLLEEEIKIGEQEREGLRIENQRLRDEHSDLKVEAEIIQGKLRHAEGIIERYREHKSSPVTAETIRPRSPMSEASTSATTNSSPSVCTPPPSKSETSTLQTSPPSPPISDASGGAKKAFTPITPLISKTRSLTSTTTPRPSGLRPPRHSRGPSIPTATPSTRTPAPSATPRIPTSRRSIATQERPPNSSSRSLHQIRGLIGRMQKLEERVHTTRSKLPAPSTPPRSSPRSNNPALTTIPSTVTVRSARKRVSASTNSSINNDPPRSASRLSFGFSGATMGTKSATGTATTDSFSRPSSRASHTGQSSSTLTPFVRPSSRASVTGRITPFGDMPTAIHRPRSSISGSYAAMHGTTTTSSSLSSSTRDAPGIPRATTPGPRTTGMMSANHPHHHVFSRSVSAAVGHDVGGGSGSGSGDRLFRKSNTPVTARRTTLDRGGGGVPGTGNGIGIPTPTGFARRQSSGFSKIGGGAVPRRQSGATATATANDGLGDMRPPSSKGRKLSEVGETF